MVVSGDQLQFNRGNCVEDGKLESRAAAVDDDDEMIMLMENLPRTISLVQPRRRGDYCCCPTTHFLSAAVEPQNHLVVTRNIIK